MDFGDIPSIANCVDVIFILIEAVYDALIGLLSPEFFESAR